MNDLNGDGGGVLQLLPLELLQLQDQRIPGWALLDESWIRETSQSQTYQRADEGA